MLPAQMTSWGFFGGAKVDFPTNTGPVQVAPASIPQPIINGNPGWPQYWRGFNAAYDPDGVLLFYVISGYELVSNKSRGGVFDADGNLIATIRGTG